MQIADLDHHLERLAEQEVADQDARLVAPQHAGGELAAAHVALVDHVVVQQRRRVHELDRGGELDMAVAGVTREFGHGQRQHRAQPLAAGGNQVVGHLRDHGHVGAGARQDGRVDSLHIRCHQFGETLERSALRTFEWNDDGQNMPPGSRTSRKHRNAVLTGQVR